MKTQKIFSAKKTFKVLTMSFALALIFTGCQKDETSPAGNANNKNKTSSHGVAQTANRESEPGITLNLKLYIQAYYIPSGEGVPAEMKPVLLNSQVSGYTDLDCDIIDVDLHSRANPENVAYTAQGVMNTKGDFSVTFPLSVTNEGEFWIAVRGRNALQVWSSLPVTLIETNSYDFSKSNSSSFGDNLMEIKPGVFALYSGDINQDGTVDGLDMGAAEISINRHNIGYFTEDLDGTGKVEEADLKIAEENANLFVSLAVPY